MDRLERLLDLVHVLHGAREPVPFSRLADTFSDYAEGKADAVRRKFERDKATLAELGIALRYVQDDEDADSGYVLDAERSFLPPLDLDETDRALLATAARAALAAPAFPYRRALRLALGKLGRPDADAIPIVVSAPGSWGAPRAGESDIEALADAVARRKKVTLEYDNARGARSAREVFPYSLFSQRGAWYLVAYDTRHEAVRVFRAGRIASLKVNGQRPGSPDFQLPEGFDPRAAATVDPARFSVHDPVAVELWVDPEVAFLVEKTFGPAPADGDGVFRFESTNLDYVVEQALRLGHRAELRAPAHGRAAVREALEAILEAHEVSS